MGREFNYCQMTGNLCVNEPVNIKPNSCFLIQPFDNDKKRRENAVHRALESIYGKGNYCLLKSDSDVTPQSSFCDICVKMKSAQFCIADISGHIYKLCDKLPEHDEIFLRPNVALELGLAFGFNKPSIILSRKLKGKRQKISDIDFIRYIDVINWKTVSNDIAARLMSAIGIHFMMRHLEPEIRLNLKYFINWLKLNIALKERIARLISRTYNINQIFKKNNDFIGVIKNAKDLKEDFCFQLYINEQGIYEKKAIVRIYDVQDSDNLALVKFYPENGSDDYWTNVIRECNKGTIFVPEKHRLEFIIPTHLENATIGEMRYLLDRMNEIRGRNYGKN